MSFISRISEEESESINNFKVTEATGEVNSEQVVNTDVNNENNNQENFELEIQNENELE